MMTLTAGGELSPRSGPPLRTAIRALLRRGQHDEAIVKLCAAFVTAPDDIAIKELLFEAFYRKRELAPALALVEELVRLRPDDVRAQRARIATLSDMRRYPEAAAQAAEFVERHGEEPAMLDVLKIAHFFMGKTADAVRYGQRAMEMRDAAACAKPPAMTMTEPAGQQARNVIAFALWGRASVYCYGAMINLTLARTVYPGWTCRFYVDAAVPRACVDFLAANGAEVREIEKEYPAVGQFQRFLVMNDPAVERFLVRDCDSRLSAAEADLVAQWIASDRPFHVVRGHVLHNELILAGLWGGRADCGIDIVALMQTYFPRGPAANYGSDQRVLSAMLWPLIRARCLVHDSHYRLAGVHTIPLPDSHGPIGTGHRNPAAVQAEAEQLGLPRL